MSRPPLEAVLGGTFDPVHRGHLELASSLRATLALPRVLLLPAALPPHKGPEEITPVGHREAMLRLAVTDCVGLEISMLELDAGGVSYTIDSLRRLRVGPPPCSPVFIVGRDALHEIPTWRLYRELLLEFDLIAIDRAGDGKKSRLHPDVAARLRRRLEPDEARVALDLEGLGRGGRIFPVGIPTLPVSSSQVRNRIGAGREVDDLVPPRVARYIHRHGLYRREGRR